MREICGACRHYDPKTMDVIGKFSGLPHIEGAAYCQKRRRLVEYDGGCKHFSQKVFVSAEKTKKAAEEGFYGTMYGEQYGPGVTIIHIQPGESDVGTDGALCYVWGWPGPDFNRYAPEDYGKTWALTEAELRNGEGAV